jgi:4-hydroxybenzoate polyprenyltransferase
MPAPRPKWLAYTQLLRLPNLFTAVADPLTGWLIIRGGGDPLWQLPVLAATSACLYGGGIVLNDCFDYRIDCRERPRRPLPAGDIARPAAWVLGVVLLLAGVGLAALVSSVALAISGFLAAMILFYNGWSKQFAGLGPLTLGVCRFANVLLGMRALPPRLWVAPVVLGVYVTAVGWYARAEVEHPGRPRVIKRLLLGIVLVDAVMVLATGDWLGALLVASLWLPAAALGKWLEMT